MKHEKILRINGDKFHLTQKQNRKHEAVKVAKKLELKGFNVRIKQQNPYLIYSKKKNKMKKQVI